MLGASDPFHLVSDTWSSAIELHLFTNYLCLMQNKSEWGTEDTVTVSLKGICPSSLSSIQLFHTSSTWRFCADSWLWLRRMLLTFRHILSLLSLVLITINRNLKSSAFDIDNWWGREEPSCSEMFPSPGNTCRLPERLPGTNIFLRSHWFCSGSCDKHISWFYDEMSLDSELLNTKEKYWRENSFQFKPGKFPRYEADWSHHM